ncbi:FkbM family methyltransferase [candidate division WOR-3 bacterium]|nr:FkbM family methyltransferase [candidate division WOR-3 bacterium]
MRKIVLLIYKKVAKIISGHRIGRFYPIRVINSFIISQLRSNFAEVQGHKMFLDSKDSLSLSIYESYEPLETQLVKREIKRGNVVLDLGANIGYYTLIFAKLVGEEGKVFAFEPDPTNFALLEKNVEMNGYKNVMLIQKAVSNKSGKLKLYLSENSMGDHAIFNLYEGCKFIEIEAIRLDDYFKNYEGKIDFIKIDTEGAEEQAIQSMLNLLKKNKTVKILTEFFPIGLKGSDIDPAEYLNTLLKLDFKLYHINEQEKKIEPASIPKLLEIYSPEKQNNTNLLCVRETRTS